MILAEKIIRLRKEQGWSQEELAMRLGVTRQSVSKWESMSSLPDLDRIVAMSKLFGVSTDYLLKDDAPAEGGCVNEEQDIDDGVRTVTLEEANGYLDMVRSSASRFANGVSLCILSPALLIMLASASENGKIAMSGSAAYSLGICALILMVAAGVALIVLTGMRLSRYEYLEKEPIRTEYGVAGIVESKRGEYEPAYKKLITIGIVACIVSVLPLMLSTAAENEFLTGCATACIFAFVAVGVGMIVRAAFVWGSYQKLLEEGDFTREKKEEDRKNEPFVAFYWCFVLAVYLALSFMTGRWGATWIIWPVMAVLFGAVMALKNMLRKRS